MGRHEIGRRAFLALGGATASSLLLPAGVARAAVDQAPGVVAVHGPQAAARWMRAAYDVVAPQNLTPPTAARLYALLSISAYEALLGGMPAHRTLQGQLTDLTGLPRPAPAGQVHWPSVLGAASAALLRGLLPQMTPAGQRVVLAAEELDATAARGSGTPRARLEHSRRHGQLVAQGVLRWAATDGHAEASSRSYTPPTGPSMWVPTPPNFGTAIEPHCADVRPLVLRSTDEVEPPPPLPFSDEPASGFWQQAQATYRQSSANTPDQRDIARFWTDNPVFSGLPAGHWLSITVQAAEQHGLNLTQTVEALARTSIALNDAFLNCWTWKYRHNLLRPVTYVRRHIDPEWSTLVNTPQFPEHTSGHSVASTAAAVVLTDVLGPLPVLDTARATTNGLAQRTRRWDDFHHAADTAAISRLYGGIHYLHGIEAGKTQGTEVGGLVLARLHTRR